MTSDKRMSDLAQLLCRHSPRPGVAISSYRLDNGLKLLVWEDHLAPVAAFYTWFAVGSGHETEGRSGMAHLFEHLMFKETRNLKSGEFDRLLELNGVTTNAATWLDWTYYQEHLPSAKLELVTRMEADRMENMILSSEQLETEREVVRNERRLRVDNDPDGQVSETLYHLHFGNHPYGHPTIGWMEDIDAITLDDCLQFYRHHYAPNNATVVVVGDVDSDAVVELVHGRYGHMGTQPVPSRPAPSVEASVQVEPCVLELPVGAPHINVLYTAPRLGHDDGGALRVLNQLMFNTDSSRVYKLLVEERELAVDSFGWYGGFALAGALEIQINLVPGGDWCEVLGLVDEQLDILVEKGCSQREVEGGKNRLEISHLRGNMSVAARARNLGYYETTLGDFRHYFSLADKVQQVTPEDVVRVAKKVLQSQGRTVVVAVPGGQTDSTE